MQWWLPTRFIAYAAISFAVLGHLLPLSEIYNGRRILLCAVIVIFAGRTLVLWSRQRALQARALLTATGGLLAYIGAITSGFLSDIHLYAWTDLHLYFAWGLAVFGIASSFGGSDPDATAREATRLAAFCAVLVAIYALMSLMGYGFYLVQGHSRLSSFIPHGFLTIRYWSHLATWLLPLLPLATMVPVARRKLWNTCLLISGALWYWILWLSMSRGSMLSIAIAAALVALIFRSEAKYWLKWHGKALAIAVPIWLILSRLLPEFVLSTSSGERSFHLSSSGRVELWLHTLELSLRNFPFGIGPLNWANLASGFRPAHPHNMYLLWAAEWGWLAVVSLAGVMIPVLRTWWRASKTLASQSTTTRSSFICFSASALAGCAHAGVSAVFIAPASMLVATFVLGYLGALTSTIAKACAIGASRPAPATRIPASARMPSTILAAVLLASFAVTNYFFYRDMKVDARMYHDQSSLGTTPRYWKHGHYPR